MEQVSNSQLYRHVAILNVKDKLVRARRQLDLLIIKRDQMEVRYNRAIQQGQQGFSYPLKLNLATLEGLITAFQKYSQLQLQQLTSLLASHQHHQHQRFNSTTSNDDDSDTESSSSVSDVEWLDEIPL